MLTQLKTTLDNIEEATLCLDIETLMEEVERLERILDIAPSVTPTMETN